MSLCFMPSGETPRRSASSHFAGGTVFIEPSDSGKIVGGADSNRSSRWVKAVRVLSSAMAQKNAYPTGGTQHPGDECYPGCISENRVMFPRNSVCREGGKAFLTSE